jgi:hypothetical protein
VSVVSVYSISQHVRLVGAGMLAKLREIVGEESRTHGDGEIEHDLAAEHLHPSH